MEGLVFILTIICATQSYILLRLVYIRLYNEAVFEKQITPMPIEDLRVCLPPAQLKDALQTLESRNQSRKAIFFIESSKKGALKPRQVCALESAATHNPDSDVFLILLDPPEDLPLLGDQVVLTMLSHHQNVQFLRAYSFSYYVGTPLHQWSVANRINSSVHPIEHSSDVTRLVTILRFGGIYLDLDFIIQQTLTSLPLNWMAYEWPDSLGSSAFGLQKGHPMAKLMAEVQAATFDGSSWAHNGPGLFGRVLEQKCGISLADILIAGNCTDVMTIRPEVFFKISYPAWGRFFDAADSDAVLTKVRDSLGVHFWNYLSHNATVQIGSDQAYSRIAQKHCPRTYWSCFNEF